MKLTIEFPSVIYREGPSGVSRLARAIESIGYDHIDVFDHVVMGYPAADRAPPRYPAQMPILEALVVLGYLAAATERVGLGTEVLVLPQRDPVLVAKQVSTLDTLSGGRIRLGVGVGWQPSEYEALGADFRTRGRRMDEAIAVLRTCFADETIDLAGPAYRARAVAMEPKPPQGRALPIWVGGTSEAALRRTGELGDGWLANAFAELATATASIERVRRAAEEAGRDSAALGFQMMLTPPPRPGDDAGRSFFADLDAVARRAAAVREAGFGWASINATMVFLAGARSLEALIDALGRIHDRLRVEVGVAG